MVKSRDGKYPDYDSGTNNNRIIFTILYFRRKYGKSR